ncbi:MAG: hypothetical protein AB1546_09760 [bacterium]
MASTEKVLEKLRNIEKEVNEIKEEIKKYLPEKACVPLRGKYSNLKGISESDFIKAKKIWEPKNT